MKQINPNKADLISLLNSVDFSFVKSAIVSGDFEKVLKAFEFYKVADTQISSELFKRRVYISGLPIYLKSQNKEQEAFIQNLSQTSDFKSLIFDLTSAICYGFMAFVKNNKNVNGVILPQYSAIDIRYFRTDNEGRLYLKQGDDKIYTDDPRLYIYHHKTDTGGVLEQSLMYKILVIASLKYLTISRFMSYFDALSVPPMVIKSDSIKDETQSMELIDAAVALRSNGVGLFSKDDIIELLDSNTSKENFMEFIRYCDECISKTITGQLLAGNALSYGTQALGKIHNEIRQDVLRFDSMLISAALQDIIKQALELNYKTVAPFSIKLDSNLEADENILSQVYERIINMGYIIPDEFMQNTFKIQGLKRADEGKTQISKNSKSYPKPSPNLPLDDIDSALNSPPYKDKEEAILNEIKKTLENLLKDATSYEDAFKKLYTLYDDAPLELLEDAMAEAIINASMAGYYNA